MADTDKVVVTKSKLTAIADAIRSKNSTTDKMSLDSIPAIIANLKTGGEPAVEYEGGDGIKISFMDNSQLTSLSFTSAFNGAIPNITNMNSMFAYCYKLASLNLSSFDTSKVTNMSSMFYACQALTSLNLSSFDTSKVTNMGYMFNNCQALTSLNLSNFDTSNVTSMSYMFNNCRALTSLNLSSFDTSKVTDMSSMFNYCRALTSLNLSSFDTSKVTSMGSMFSYCSSLTSLRFPSNKSFDIKDTALAHDGLVVLLNDLKSVTTTQTLKMGSKKLALLSNAEKKIATDKGWTLA